MQSEITNRILKQTNKNNKGGQTGEVQKRSLVSSIVNVLVLITVLWLFKITLKEAE